MDENIIIQKLQNIVSSIYEDDETQIILNDYFKVIDSMKFIELLTKVEIEFDIEIEDNDFNLMNAKDTQSFLTMIKKYV